MQCKPFTPLRPTFLCLYFARFVASKCTQLGHVIFPAFRQPSASLWPPYPEPPGIAYSVPHFGIKEDSSACSWLSVPVRAISTALPRAPVLSEAEKANSGDESDDDDDDDDDDGGGGGGGVSLLDPPLIELTRPSKKAPATRIKRKKSVGNFRRSPPAASQGKRKLSRCFRRCPSGSSASAMFIHRLPPEARVWLLPAPISWSNKLSTDRSDELPRLLPPNSEGRRGNTIFSKYALPEPSPLRRALACLLLSKSSTPNPRRLFRLFSCHHSRTPPSTTPSAFIMK